MTWIMLIKKPPTKPSPPKFSIFYALPARADNVYASQKERFLEPDGDGKWWDGIEIVHEEPDVFYTDPIFGGKEENARNWLKIHYAGTDITVQPHEFSILTMEKMHGYVLNIDPDVKEPVYTLEENSDASKLMLATALETDLRTLYEAAMLDGCNEQQALMVAMQMDITDLDIEFPNVGWYKPVRGLGVFETFADDWELMETPPYTEEEKRQMAEEDKRRELEAQRRSIAAGVKEFVDDELIERIESGNWSLEDEEEGESDV